MECAISTVSEGISPVRRLCGRATDMQRKRVSFADTTTAAPKAYRLARVLVLPKYMGAKVNYS